MSAGWGAADYGAGIALGAALCLVAEWAFRAWHSERRSRQLARELEPPLWIGAPTEPLGCPASYLGCRGFTGFTADPRLVLASDRYQRCPLCCATFDHATGRIVGSGGAPGRGRRP